MRIFYTQTGMIADAVTDQSLSIYDTTRLTSPQLYIDIDESANADLCRDLAAWGVSGKYEVDPQAQTLMENLDWQPTSILNP